MNCIIDSGTTCAILKDKEYFTSMQDTSTDITIKTISGTMKATGIGRALIKLPNGTKLEIKRAIYVQNGSKNLIGFGDFRENGLHLATAMSKDDKEFL